MRNDTHSLKEQNCNFYFHILEIEGGKSVFACFYQKQCVILTIIDDELYEWAKGVRTEISAHFLTFCSVNFDLKINSIKCLEIKIEMMFNY